MKGEPMTSDKLARAAVGCLVVIAAALVSVVWSLGLWRLLFSLVTGCDRGGVREWLSAGYTLLSLFFHVAYGLACVVVVRARYGEWLWVFGALGGALLLAWIYLVTGSAMWGAVFAWFDCPADIPIGLVNP
jgi:hypothetical protein